MKNHTSNCEILSTGVCTCMVTSPHPHPSADQYKDRVRSDIEDFRHRFGRLPNSPDELTRWLSVKSAGVHHTRNIRAGQSRLIDTEEKVTWLGDQRHVHPRSCGVYGAPEPNWAKYCTCYIGRLQDSQSQHPFVPMTDPADFAVPKEGPQMFESHAPWWVWTLMGFGGGIAILEIAQRTLGV